MNRNYFILKVCIKTDVKDVEDLLEILKQDGFVKKIGYLNSFVVYAIDFEVRFKIKTRKFSLIFYRNTEFAAKHETYFRFDFGKIG